MRRYGVLGCFSASWQKPWHSNPSQQLSMKAPLYSSLWASWMRWPIQLRDTQQPRASSHLIPLCLGFLTTKRKSFNPSLLCKPAGKPKKQTYITLIGSALLGWKMPREGLPQGTNRTTGMSVGAERTQPEGWLLLLLPGMAHGAVLCWSQEWVTFFPSCTWRMTLHPPVSDSGNSEKCTLKVPQNI